MSCQGQFEEGISIVPGMVFYKSVYSQSATSTRLPSQANIPKKSLS